MFPYPIATPQDCNIQTFYGVLSAASKINTFMWNKPVGVSHVYMMLIGAGGSGDSSESLGGGSGAVTVWYGAAQHVPDNLQVQCGSSQVGSEISFLSRSSSVILQAAAGQGNAGGVATSAPAFAASGFYKSTAGQTGAGGDVSASGTTFLSGGGSSGGTNTANYGYTRLAGNTAGFFLMQPIIVGMGGGGVGNGSFGCGGGIDGTGGPGMVLIASW
jgi:hypothetical protein